MTPAHHKLRMALRRVGAWGYYLDAELAVRSVLRRELAAPRFVVFAQGRSGSRLLCELLGSHSRIHCDMEMLADRVPDPYRLVRRLAMDSSRQGYGFKVKVYQLTDQQGVDPKAFLRRLHAEGWHIVYLWRRNIFRQVFSGAASRIRATAHTRASTRSKAMTPVQLDVDDLLVRMRRRQGYLALERDALAGLPHLCVNYEDDLYRPSDQQRAVNRIVKALGFETELPDTDLVPNTPKSLRDVIANLSHVAERLRGTEFEEHFLEATSARK